jgi:hypothetical protein
MKWISVLTIGIAVVSSSAIAEDNPDFCSLVRETGDLSTRNFDFTIIIQQVANVSGGVRKQVTDGSFFIPGNKNFEIHDSYYDELFDVSIFKNASRLSSASDPKVYAQELLATEPDLFYADTESAKDPDGFNVIYMNPDITTIINRYDDNLELNSYDDSSTGDLRRIFCEPAFGVPAE